MRGKRNVEIESSALEFTVRSLENIISDSMSAHRHLLQEAFDAGRNIGREEAAAYLRAQIDGVLSSNHGALEDATKSVTKPTVAADPDKRAVAGSVRPTILRMIISSANTGLTQDEIAKETGFKFNSVRGTLWALGRDGVAVKRDNRWFPVEQNYETGDDEEVSTAS